MQEFDMMKLSHLDHPFSLPLIKSLGTFNHKGGNENWKSGGSFFM
jgi:hypothetical protein